MSIRPGAGVRRRFRQRRDCAGPFGSRKALQRVIGGDRGMCSYQVGADILVLSHRDRRHGTGRIGCALSGSPPLRAVVYRGREPLNGSLRI